MNNEIKPCPFCGSNDIDHCAWRSQEDSGPGCMECGATAENLEAWNKRSFTLNREKLAKAIYTYHQRSSYGIDATPWERVQGHIELKRFYLEADVILSALPEIVEVCND